MKAWRCAARRAFSLVCVAIRVVQPVRDPEILPAAANRRTFALTQCLPGHVSELQDHFSGAPGNSTAQIPQPSGTSGSQWELAWGQACVFATTLKSRVRREMWTGIVIKNSHSVDGLQSTATFPEMGVAKSLGSYIRWVTAMPDKCETRR
jgi:hypothetical protein